ncbi:MAG: hypothetical protein U9O56_01370 [Campylobacterota bacterium]|nr:hypothetical protein [Campylobacterota bacterium]
MKLILVTKLYKKQKNKSRRKNIENEIVEVIDSEPKVSVLIIAENTDNKYESVRDLVKKYEIELQKFGLILLLLRKRNRYEYGIR